ncbi:myeloperoxidase-like, partial [Pituophis catenifer annectens]|uniref:myeloperoxidase-like n=1 Tax=Pituophis catenifer annectens TaxID=94852 RepID=UPI003991C12F
QGLRLFFVLLGILIAVKLHEADNLSLQDTAKKLEPQFLLQNVEEAKKLVDAAYEYTQNWLEEKLKKETVRPSEILVSFKQPIGKTRLHVKAAHYMLVTLDLLKEKLQNAFPQEFNITDVLSPSQMHTIYKATGCASQEIRTKECDEKSPYRTITGECNNLRIPTLGSSNRPYVRWLPQEYEDGVSLPRGWTETKPYFGHPLPLVRAVSNDIVFFPNVNVTNDPFRSVLFMQWGQFIDHDLDFGPSVTATLTFIKGLDCGKSCEKAPPCFPIKIPPHDPTQKRECMPFTRSAPACNGGYAIRNQINALTSFVDASMVYASEDKWAMQLRNFTNDLGLLAVNNRFNDRGLSFLPFGNPEGFRENCNVTNATLGIPCFLAGDNRVNEMPGLIALQTLFMREHNRLATELKRLNPQMRGEELYQETRKIVGALMQKITYTEYIPAVLGETVALPRYRGYNDSVDPRIASSFTNAFRFGHTLVRPTVPRLDSRYQVLSETPLENEFFATWRVIFQGGIEPILRGQIGTPAKLLRQDQLVVEGLRDRLFQQPPGPGLDLPSLNMQRGRDHGLPGYNAWRQLCGLSQPLNETELAEVLQNPQVAKKFIQHYGTPKNIDLWVGGVSEPLLRNARVGPLLACIFRKQFQNLRDGDRFWWENPGVFTPAQRQALNQATLARVICDNTYIREVPRFIFRANQYPRNFVNCTDFPRLSLFPWKKPPQ